MHVRSRHLLLPLVLFVAALLAPAAPPARAEPLAARQPKQIGFFGMNTYFSGHERYFNDKDDGIATLVARGREAGVGWAREELSWANLEPSTKGAWDWKWTDQRIRQLAEAGYGIVGMLLTTPTWARVADCKQRARAAATEEYWCPPANPKDYSDYVWTMIERYDGDGVSDAPGSPRVAAWQIWNEPSAPLTWPGSPEEYGRMLVAAYQAGKAADATATIALGGVYIFDGLGTDPTDGIPFYSRMIAAVPESALTWDALAIHPFMTSAAPDALGIFSTITVWGRIQTAQRWLEAHPRGREARPLWISEMGWAVCTCGDSRCPDSINRSEYDPATYLVRAYAVALALGVQHVSYFQLEDKFDGTWGNACGDAAAVLGTRSQSYRYKPAFFAYQTMAQRLNGARFLGFGNAHTWRYNPRDQNRNGTYHLRFATASGRVDVLWRTAGEQSVSVPLEGGRGELITRDGTRTPLGVRTAQFSVGEAPAYLQHGR
jgi:hypothetical protein